MPHTPTGHCLETDIANENAVEPSGGGPPPPALPSLPGQQQHELGCGLCEQGQYAEALTPLSDALLEMETSDRWNDWATVQMALGEHALAERAYRRALQMNPEQHEAALNLGILLKLAGRPAEALPLLEQGTAFAEEPLRSTAFGLQEECRREIVVSPPVPETPPHLGGHCGVTHIDEGVLDWLIEKFGIRSMIDVGCGTGGMVRLARQKGLRVLGVDGDLRVRELSGLDPADLLIHDFTQGPLQLPPEWQDGADLIWSVEFLEHVEEPFQENYMTLFRQGKRMFCTAAPPGKPGTHHANCRDEDYWREVFRQRRLLYDAAGSQTLRGVSTMPREFVRETGMLFARDEQGSEERFTPQIPGQREILQAALPLLRPGDRVLDLGAGRCEASRLFARAGCRDTALGMHFDRYLDAPAKAELESLGVTLQEGSFEGFEGPDSFDDGFDALWASHVLEHQPNAGWFLERCLSLLRPGGWLLLTVPPAKTQVVSGHVSVWFPGLLLYNLVLTGLDCSRIHMARIGYNIAAFVENYRRPLPPLTSSLGDIELLANRFPPGMAYQGFEGEFDRVNWPPR